MVINFFTRKSGSKKQNLYVRLSHAGQSTEIKLDFIVNSNSKKVEAYRSNVFKELSEIFNERLVVKEPADPATIKSIYQSKHKTRYLIETYQEYMNLKIFPKFEKGIILQSTVQKYQVTLNQLKDFLNARQTDDVNILSVNREFIDDFQNFLHQFNAHNSTMRHLSYFKCIMTHAVNVKGYLLKNPFDSIKLGKKKHTPVFLEESELQRIMRKKFLVDRLNKVRDLFLFQCFTGLSYADMMLFRPENVQNNYVRIYRKKSTEPAVIYVYDIAMKILEKYGNSLPKVSNQKMNGYLKEIADLCQITKNLTTHVARHTFATTVNLNNGIPIEVVQTLLGHASIKQTEHYARLQTRSVLKHCNSNNLQLNKVFNAEQLSINFTNLQNSNTN